MTFAPSSCNCHKVSLFTREWIEIACSGVDASRNFASPSLRGSGLKYVHAFLPVLPNTSPSLRGSGLKSLCSVNIVKYALVSLFTREWIEICFSAICIPNAGVSLFTREWIEVLS